MRRAFTAVLFLGVLVVPNLALAQEKSDVGVTMGYPASIGLIWHASEKIAIRPEFAFTHSENDGHSTFTTTEGSGNSVGVGASVLFYLRKWDHLQTYVSPRYTYSRTTSESHDLNPPNSSSESKTTSNQASGYFGAQYSPHQRFSVFGEAGYGWTRTTGELLSGSSTSTTTSKGTRTGVGVIFYF
jgi:hypothetical protein